MVGLNWQKKKRRLVGFKMWRFDLGYFNPFFTPFNCFHVIPRHPLLFLNWRWLTLYSSFDCAEVFLLKIRNIKKQKENWNNGRVLKTTWQSKPILQVKWPIKLYTQYSPFLCVFVFYIYVDRKSNTHEKFSKRGFWFIMKEKEKE